MRKPISLIIWVAFLCLIWEGGCVATLKVFQYLKGMSYSPLATEELSAEQKEILIELLEGRTRYTTHDPILGWAIKPNGKVDLYQANSQSLRATREYSVFKGPGSYRIATFGDSFTHGDEVDNPSTWEVQLESLDSTYQVMNFGVGGYGPDQAYMRYVAEGRQFHPDVVLIGFMSENIFRTVSVFRPFYSSASRLPLSKPRFIFDNGALVLRENPLKVLQGYSELLHEPAPLLRKLGEMDWFYQNRYRKGFLDFLSSIRLMKMVWYEHIQEHEFSYQNESESFRLSVELVAKFYKDVEQDSSVPIVVLFPGRKDLEERLAGRNPPYRSYMAALKEKYMRVIDLAGAFDCNELRAQMQEYFQKNGHYSGKANGLVAGYLKTYVDEVHGGGKAIFRSERTSCRAGVSPENDGRS